MVHKLTVKLVRFQYRSVGICALYKVPLIHSIDRMHADERDHFWLIYDHYQREGLQKLFTPADLNTFSP